MSAEEVGGGARNAEAGRDDEPSRSAVQAMCGLAGVQLSSERLEALMTQAKAHFELMEVVARLDPGDAEPAGEFRLVRQEARKDGR